MNIYQKNIGTVSVPVAYLAVVENYENELSVNVKTKVVYVSDCVEVNDRLIDIDFLEISN